MSGENDSPMSTDSENDESTTNSSRKKETRITAVDLGFIEPEPADDAFSPQVFPSKVGGKPVWLDPRSVIDADAAKCEVCAGPLVLLTQIYCPLPKRDKDAYHRTVYVFMCPRRECCCRNSCKNFAVFRSQLPEENQIYALEDAPKVLRASFERVYETTLPQLCAICGMKGPFRCSRCKSVSYCSREHQTHDWHFGGHKGMCNELKDLAKEEQEVKLAKKPASAGLTLPEFELCIEPEPAISDKEKKAGDDELKNLDGFTKEQTEIEEEDTNLESQITESKKDPAFSRFLRRIKRRPSQVIRYELGSTPLWPASVNKPENIPECELCGAPRQFEFQIMPQLLTYLPLDDESAVGANGIDWATLAIYTCSVNCETITSAKHPCCAREFLWKQDYSE